jgi:hypothetical protein
MHALFPTNVAPGISGAATTSGLKDAHAFRNKLIAIAPPVIEAAASQRTSPPRRSCMSLLLSGGIKGSNAANDELHLDFQRCDD